MNRSVTAKQKQSVTTHANIPMISAEEKDWYSWKIFDNLCSNFILDNDINSAEM